jgi:hypothetical protein
MSDQMEDIVENLKQSSLWVRILLMIGFAFVLYLVIVPAIIILAIAQALFAAITGEPNGNLRGLGSLIQQYVSQIIAFVTYNSELRPFPFSEFPSEELFDAEEKAAKPQTAKKKANKQAKPVPSADAKATVKKAVKKKAPAKKPAKAVDEAKPAAAADDEVKTSGTESE